MDGAVIPLRYCITRTPDVVRIDAATLAKSKRNPARVGGGPPWDKGVRSTWGEYAGKFLENQTWSEIDWERNKQREEKMINTPCNFRDQQG